MARLIKVDPNRTDNDNWVLFVRPYMEKSEGALPVYNKDGKIIAYNIKPLFE